MPRFSLLRLLACLVVGCGSSTPSAAPDCPEVHQAGCPPGTPTYDTGIGDLLTERCRPCHAPGGIEASQPLTNYDQAHGMRTGIGTQLLTCSMPQAGAPPLSNDERKQILDWLTCGALR